MPFFAIVLGVIALVGAGEGWCLFRRAQAARRAQERLEQKRGELRSLSTVEPAPTEANAALIEADLERTTRSLALVQAELKGRGPAAAALRAPTAPERRTDAYFDLAAFVEHLRDEARRRGIALRADERFGFAEYADAGPDPERIAAVFQERLIVQHLLEALFAAQPRQLLAVQRERPLTPAERAAAAERPAPPPNDPDGSDYFAIDPRFSARVPGLVAATAFRLTFVGQTATLRALLNKLAGFELPLVVRGVEVEPAGVAPEAVAVEAPAAGAARPLIRRAYSRFTVTVEFIDLVPPVT